MDLLHERGSLPSPYFDEPTMYPVDLAQRGDPCFVLSQTIQTTLYLYIHVFINDYTLKQYVYGSTCILCFYHWSLSNLVVAPQLESLFPTLSD